MAGKQVFNGLDALRGYAAIAVLVFHSSGLLGMTWLFPSGYLSVDLFFAMSGFVIAHSYQKLILERGWVWFMKVRIKRFLPLYVLGGVFGLVRVAGLLAVGSDTRGWVAAAVAYFAFLPAPVSPFSGGAMAPLNAPAWSLLYELYANLVLAIILPWLTNRLLALIIFVTGTILLTAALNGIGLVGYNLSDFGLGFVRTFFSISMGVSLYRLRRHIPTAGIHPIVLPIIVIAVVQLPPNPMYSFAFVLFGSPLILAAGVASSASNVASRYGASSSFAIYALHVPILGIASGVISRMNLASELATGLIIVACAIFAPYVDRHFDRPLRYSLKPA